jgi:hypothetical protein
MAKLTYLQLVNRILPKITQSAITDVTAATGKALLIANYINEAQTFLLSQADWYSLYKMRRWSTVTYSAATISFSDSNPDTIDDSDSAFVTQGFQSNQTVLVSGASNDANNGLLHVDTAAAGSLTLQSSHVLTAESAGSTITITAVSYPVASDHGRTIDLMDTTNNNLLIEDDTVMFDLDDPNFDDTGNPYRFTVQGSSHRLSPIPDGDYIMLERYWKIPDILATNSATSDLPIECENLILLYAEMQILEYSREFERADRVRAELQRQLKDAFSSNKRKINKMRILGDRGGLVGGTPGIPSLPSTYDRRYR